MQTTRAFSSGRSGAFRRDEFVQLIRVVDKASISDHLVCFHEEKSLTGCLWAIGIVFTRQSVSFRNGCHSLGSRVLLHSSSFPQWTGAVESLAQWASLVSASCLLVARQAE